MNDAVNSFCIESGDLLFGWLLPCPRDVTVILLGTMLAGLLLLVRRVTVDQAHWRLIGDDERRLKELIRAARAAHAHEELVRHRLVRRLVAAQRVRTEWIWICASAIILTAIVPWCRRRLEFIPVRDGDIIRFVVRLPYSAPGEVAHVVPQAGLTAPAGWVRVLDSHTGSGLTGSTAEWSLQVTNRPGPRQIVVRLRNQTLVHAVSVGGARYEMPVQRHANGVETEIVLSAYRPLALLPARVAPGVPGWSLLMTLVMGGIVLGARRPRQSGRPRGPTALP